ncbi:ABC transporter substrate-binding protein [Cellulomonas sp. URHD0024]|uniref:ABC transporter substrate-binding protein n=1 Tax=Cellulomonas sp. URHD0024 TaxID=1302620 RepID=UPI00048484DB|nr:ABC transporter substrate-binding protein [Cellulomonas sp. URHD0024]
MRTRKLATMMAGMATIALLATACSSGDDSGDKSSSTTGPAASNAVLTIGMPNNTQTNNQNPFATGASITSLGYATVIYEPLMLPNEAQPSAAPEPWLADSITWNDDFTSAVVKIHPGIKWSDGEAFTADDVAFSLNLRKTNDAINSEGLPYADVTKTDDSTVTVTFKSGQFVNQAKFAKIIMVPEHIWSKIADPTKDPNLKPVGTGPYTLTSWTPQAATLDINKDYWGTKPQVHQLRYSSYANNTALTTALTTGEVQWGWTFIADYEKVYIAKDPTNYHQWAAAGLGIDALFMNQTKKPFNNLAFRQALNTALDRENITKIATSGVNPVLENVTGLPLPAGKDFVSPAYEGKNYASSVDDAKAILTAAGYTWNGDALIDPDGEPVKFAITDPTGWNDYNTAQDLLVATAKELGADASALKPPSDNWFQDVPLGNFDAAYHWTDSGATPYDTYADIFDPSYNVAIGETANWNFGRYSNDAVAADFKTYASSADASARDAALANIQKTFVEDVPGIALWSRPQTAQYSSKNYVGWPDADNPYAAPQPTRFGAEKVILSLKPAS